MEFVKNGEELLNRLNTEEEYVYSQIARIRRLGEIGRDEIREGDAVYELFSGRKDHLVHRLGALCRERELVEHVLRAWNSLDLQTRKILSLLFLDGRTWDWISLELNISKASISRRRREGLTLLMKKTENLPMDGESGSFLFLPSPAATS